MPPSKMKGLLFFLFVACDHGLDMLHCGGTECGQIDVDEKEGRKGEG